VSSRLGDALPTPPPLARRWAARVVGFGIAVGIGMAPFLGKVAGVDALLDLFPKNLHGTLLPLSVFLMGIIAVAIQFHSGETIARARLRRRFSFSLSGLLAGLVLFIAFYSLFVKRVPYHPQPGVEESAPVIIAWSRIDTCGCPDGETDLECLRSVSTTPEAIESCWGSRPLQLVRLALSLAYLALTGGFAALVGLLVLQEEIARRQRPAPRRRSRRPPPRASRKKFEAALSRLPDVEPEEQDRL
jgi:TRAP-type C4-dicarboxylate transport system permease small subunit